MKLPAGIAPGVGIAAGGRRLAVTCVQGTSGGDGVGAGADGALIESAASVIRSGLSELDPQPAARTAARAMTSQHQRARLIGTPGGAARRRAPPAPRRSR